MSGPVLPTLTFQMKNLFSNYSVVAVEGIFKFVTHLSATLLKKLNRIQNRITHKF